MEDAARQTGPSDLAAIERFVVDNDDLLELESLIGRFNIFDALGIVHNEIRHSNFLAWLLDPGESHSLGPLFLNAVLMDLLRNTPSEQRLFSPIRLDGGELRGVRVRREWNRIDLLITCEDPDFVIAIENKIHSGEHSDQLARYRKIVHETPELAKHAHRQFVYLTRDGDEPSEDDWTIYSYADLHRVLTKVRAASGDQMGDDVRAFLDHYLRMIGSRFMDDPRIDELCQTIYKNHRQAIDLIFEYGAPGPGRITGRLKEMLDKDERVDVVSSASSRIRFIPLTWRHMLPPIGREGSLGSTNWLNLALITNRKGCVIQCLVRPTTETDLRLKVIDRLIDDTSEFGLKTFFKNRQHLGSHFAKLGREVVMSWTEDEGPSEDKLLIAVTRKLDQWLDRLAGVPDALRPIVERWERERQGKKSAD